MHTLALLILASLTVQIVGVTLQSMWYLLVEIFGWVSALVFVKILPTAASLVTIFASFFLELGTSFLRNAVLLSLNGDILTSIAVYATTIFLLSPLAQNYFRRRPLNTFFDSQRIPVEVTGKTSSTSLASENQHPVQFSDRLTELVQGQEGTHAAAQHEYANARQESKMQIHLRQVQLQRDILQSEMSHASNRCRDLSAENSSLKAAQVVAQRRIREQRRELTAFRKENYSLSHRLQSVESQVTALILSISNEKNMTTSIKEQFEELQREAEEKEVEIEHLENEIRDQDLKVIDLQAKLADYRHDLTASVKECNSLRNLVREAFAQMSAAHFKAEGLEVSLEEFRTNHSTLENNYQRLTAQLEEEQAQAGEDLALQRRLHAQQSEKFRSDLAAIFPPFPTPPPASHLERRRGLSLSDFFNDTPLCEEEQAFVSAMRRGKIEHPHPGPGRRLAASQLALWNAGNDSSGYRIDSTVDNKDETAVSFAIRAPRASPRAVLLDDGSSSSSDTMVDSPDLNAAPSSSPSSRPRGLMTDSMFSSVSSRGQCEPPVTSEDPLADYHVSPFRFPGAPLVTPADDSAPLSPTPLRRLGSSANLRSLFNAGGKTVDQNRVLGENSNPFLTEVSVGSRNSLGWVSRMVADSVEEDSLVFSMVN